MLAVFCCCWTAQADQSVSPLPPGPFQFTGSWNCTGKFGSGKSHKADFSAAIVLDGKWLELTERDVEPATGYVAKYLIGYDSQQRRLVEFDANNFGAAVYTSEQGWQGNVLAMASSAAHNAQSSYAADRFLYSISGKDEFTVDWQISKSLNLNWVPADHLVCKRSAA